MPSDGNLAKRKLMFTYRTVNYCTINNFGRLPLLIWTVNTSDIEQTLGTATLPNPKSGIIFLLKDILCVSFAMDEPTPTTSSPGRGVTPLDPGAGD